MEDVQDLGQMEMPEEKEEPSEEKGDEQHGESVNRSCSCSCDNRTADVRGVLICHF